MLLQGFLKTYDITHDRISSAGYLTFPHLEQLKEEPDVDAASHLYSLVECELAESFQFDAYLPYATFIEGKVLTRRAEDLVKALLAERSLADFYRMLDYPPVPLFTLESILKSYRVSHSFHGCILHAAIMDHLRAWTVAQTEDPLPEQEFSAKQAFDSSRGLFHPAFVSAVENFVRKEHIEGRDLTRRLGISLPTLKKYTRVSMNSMMSGFGRKPEGFKPDIIIEAFNQMLQGNDLLADPPPLPSVDFRKQLESSVVGITRIRLELESLEHRKLQIQARMEKLNQQLKELQKSLDNLVESNVLKQGRYDALS